MARPADVDRNSLSGPDRPNWWIVALVWAVPATIAMLQVVEPAMFATRGVTNRDWTLAGTQFARNMLWAPLTPLIFAAVRRFPFQRPQLARSIAIHACFALLCIAFVEALTEQIQSLMFVNADMRRPQTRRVLLAPSLGPIFSRLSIGVVAYSAVGAIASAFDYQRRLRDEAVRVAQLQRDLSESQVQAIKMQVQPHFLFNTLHAVNVLIEKDRSRPPAWSAGSATCCDIR